MISNGRKKNASGYGILEDEGMPQSFSIGQPTPPANKESKDKDDAMSAQPDSLTFDNVVKKPYSSSLAIHDVFNGGPLTEENNPTYYSWWFGTTLQPNEYYLAHVNQNPVLIPPSPNGLGVAMRWFAWLYYNLFGGIQVVRQTDEYFGAFNKHVLNVQPGKIAKMYTSEGPVLYGPGTHVINDPNCRTRLDRRENGHPPDTIYATDTYIQHGNIHILNVPQGKVAKIVVDGVDMLLEGRGKPYVFRTNSFKVSDAQNYLVDASSSAIIHGRIKRLLPDEAQVFIVSRAGKFEIVKTKTEGTPEPIILNSPYDKFIGSLPIGLHTPKFPSKYVEDYRVNHEKMAITDAAYNFYTTQDGLKLGLKVIASYRISDPLALVKNLPMHDVQDKEQGVALIEHLNKSVHKHIESMIEAKLQLAISHALSTDFLPNMRDIADEKEIKRSAVAASPIESRSSTTSSLSPSAPEDAPHALLDVQNFLREDFATLGIKLENLLIDQVRINQDVQNTMAQQALKTKELENKRALLAKEQQLELEVVKQKQVVADREAATRASVALADADARLKVAEKDAQAKQVLASVYERNPTLVQLELAATMRDAMNGSQATFIIGDASRTGGSQPFNFFPTVPASGRLIDQEQKSQQRAVI